MSIKNRDEHVFLNESDLTDAYLEVTRVTYEDNADSYVLNYERRTGALDETRLFTVDPFLKSFRDSKLKGKILFAGCGSGRDMEGVANEGFNCVGVDISSHMINIGKIMGIKQPMFVMDMENLDFPPESFDGIFCETALAHVKRSALPQTLKNFNNLLTRKGVALITFRKGDGRIYYTEDKVGGRRYYTTVTEKEAEKLIKDAGFELLSSSTHQVGTKPPYYNLITIKK